MITDKNETEISCNIKINHFDPAPLFQAFQDNTQTYQFIYGWPIWEIEGTIIEFIPNLSSYKFMIENKIGIDSVYKYTHWECFQYHFASWTRIKALLKYFGHKIWHGH